MFAGTARIRVKALLVMLLLVMPVMLPVSGASALDTRVSHSAQAYFTAEPMIGYAPLDVELDATDDIPTDFYSWELDWDGDGMVDDEGNGDPVYDVTYENPGRYYPVFTFYNNDFGVISRVTAEVIVNMPQDEYPDDGGGIGTPALSATLIVEPQDGYAPLDVTFEAEGIDEDYYYYWEIDYDGDGLPDDDDYDDPQGEHTYESAGTYYPTIVFYNDDYGVAATAQAVVTVEESAETGGGIGTPGLGGTPMVTLYADPEAGEAPLTVEFELDGIDEDNYASWALDYDGDGAADLDDYGEFKAEITYAKEGMFYPAVVLLNDDGGIVAQAWGEIEVYPGDDWATADPALTELLPGQSLVTPAPHVLVPTLNPTLTATPDYGNPPLSVQFSASGIDSDDYVTWELDWDGDGAYDGGDKGSVNWLVIYDKPGRYFPTVWFYDANHNLIAEAFTEVFVEEPVQFKLDDDKWFPFDDEPELLAERWEPRVKNVKQVTLTASPQTGEAIFEPEFTVGGLDFNFWLWELDMNGDGRFDRSGQTMPGPIKACYDQPGNYIARIQFFNDGNQLIAEGQTQVPVSGTPQPRPPDRRQDAQKIIATPDSGYAPLVVALDARPIEPANWYAWSCDQGDGVSLYPEGRPYCFVQYDNPGTYLAKVTFYDVTYRELAYGEAEIKVGPGGSPNKLPPATVMANLHVKYIPGGLGPWEVTYDAHVSLPFTDLRMFRWDTTGSGGYDIQLSDYYTHTCTYNRPGRYTVGLEVEDKNGVKDHCERTIVLGECYAALNCMPARSTAPFTVRCDASGSWSAHGIKRYLWKAFPESERNTSDNEYYIDSTTAPYWETTFTQPDKYVVVVAVDDGRYTEMNYPKAYSSIEVASTGTAPKVNLSASATAGPVPLGITFGAGHSSDADGLVTSYTWDADINDGVDPVTLTHGGATFGHTYEQPGKYTASLYVTDNDNLSSDIATVEIIALAKDGGPPIAALTASPIKGTAPLTVKFDATGSSDADGKIVQYLLKPDHSAQSSMLTNDTGKFEYTYNYSGSYTAKAMVIDDNNYINQNIATVQIVVAAGGQEPYGQGGPVAEVKLSVGSGADSLKASFDATGSRVLDKAGQPDANRKIVDIYFDPNYRDSRDGYCVKDAQWEHTYGSGGTYYAAVILQDDLGRKSKPVVIAVKVTKPKG